MNYKSRRANLSFIEAFFSKTRYGNLIKKLKNCNVEKLTSRRGVPLRSPEISLKAFSGKTLYGSLRKNIQSFNHTIIQSLQIERIFWRNEILKPAINK